MNEFQAGLYSEMRSVDRVMLYLAKASELIELQSLMTKEDKELILNFLKMEEKR